MTPQAAHRLQLSFAPLRSMLEGLGAVLGSVSDSCAAAREAEFLLGLSDTALARRGLTRDRVVHHAFRRYLEG